MEKYLSEDVRVKSVKIKKVYPSELVVRIEGNKPYSYLRQKNNFLCNKQRWRDICKYK